MSTHTITLPANLFRAVHNTAAEGDSRYYLCGYHLHRASETTVELTGTDGHGLTRVTHTTTPMPEFKDVIIPRIKNLKKAAAMVGLTWDDDGLAPKRITRVEVFSKTGRLLDTFEATEVDGKYPDTASAIPKEFADEPEGGATFNYSLVTRVTEALAPDSPIATLLPPTTDPQGKPVKPTDVRSLPWAVEVQGHKDVLAVVMPARR